MALHDRPVRLTYKDYLDIPEDGRRHEILDGEHFVTPAPSRRHQAVSIRLSSILHLFVDEHGLGEVYAAPFDVVLSNHDIVEPDVLFVSAQRLSHMTEGNFQGAPDLVVEILSPGTRRVDLGLKLERYEAFGVLEYWLVDPDGETVTVHRLEEGGFGKAVALDADDVLTTPLLPGLKLRLEKIFAKSAHPG
jgi:Uma2 family endonuclease